MCIAVVVWQIMNSGVYVPPGDAPLSAETLQAEDPGTIDATPREMGRVGPGTLVDDGPPEGWSHLIIKSHPFVGDDTRGEISNFLAEQAGLLFTTITANVATDLDRGSRPFYLGDVAIGLGKGVDGRDMILSSETQSELGADMGFLERRTLAGGEDELFKMRCVARSRNMAVLDTPGVVLRGEKHRQVVLRYVVLVNSGTGGLETLLWTLESESEEQAPVAVGPMQLLPPSLVLDCELHVDTDEFIFGVPNAMGFAMTSIPQGRTTIAIPETLAAAVGQSPLTEEAARELQQELTGLLWPPTSPP